MSIGGGRLQEIITQREPPPCIFVVMGATGDLTARKIAPALYNLAREQKLNERTVVLGVARMPRSDQQFRQEMLDAIRAHSRSQPIDESLWNQFAARWFYQVTEAGDKQAYVSLAKRLDELDKEYGVGGGRLFYLAIVPETFEEVVTNLSLAGLNKPTGAGGFVRVVVEKPFGEDLASARQLNQMLLQRLEEGQIFRIDHYLGKETVMNLIALRFANAIIEPLLNRQYVDHVQITTAETAGMEGRRGAYYEKSGALRDMVQSHMLQLLVLTAMEVPAHMDGAAIRNEKVKVLRSIAALTPEQVARRTIRGQYEAGPGGRGYRQETGVASDSEVETYAAVTLFVDNWRWAGVPFHLRTGKRLSSKVSHVLIVFKREPLNLFDELGCDMRGPNRLMIRIYPDEGVSLTIDGKLPGAGMILRPVKMNLSYESAFESASPEAYENLILDALAGDATLFLRDDEVEASWRIIDSIRTAWNHNGLPKLIMYPAGSSGPQEAQNLLGDPYKPWHPI